jgi:hypothetical protein
MMAPAVKIAKHLQTLRKDIEGLTGAVAEAGANAPSARAWA